MNTSQSVCMSVCVFFSRRFLRFAMKTRTHAPQRRPRLPITFNAMTSDDKPFNALSHTHIPPLVVVCHHGGQHCHTTLTHDKVIQTDDARPLCAKTKDRFPSGKHIHSKAAFENQFWITFDTLSADDDSANTMAVFIIFIIISVAPMTVATSPRWQSQQQQKEYHVVRAKGPVNSRMDHDKQTNHSIRTVEVPSYRYHQSHHRHPIQERKGQEAVHGALSILTNQYPPDYHD